MEHLTMKKSSTLKSAQKNQSTQPSGAAPKIPKDLSDLWGAVEACATACNVISKGMYGPEWLKSVNATHGFLYKLYENAIEAAAQHPQADLIPELKAYKDKPKKSEATNGETKETSQAAVQ
jgi:hypothetical protein